MQRAHAQTSSQGLRFPAHGSILCFLGHSFPGAHSLVISWGEAGNLWGLVRLVADPVSMLRGSPQMVAFGDWACGVCGELGTVALPKPAHYLISNKDLFKSCD